MPTSTKKHKYLIPIPAHIERALKHAAIARGLSVSATIVAAITELAERDGWLRDTEPPVEVSNA